MSISVSGFSNLINLNQRFNREINSTIERLNAGVTVRPKDDPAAFAAYQQTLESENRIKTASINAERAQAFGTTALDKLGQAADILDELRQLYVQDSGGDTQSRIDSLLEGLDRINSESTHKGHPLFTNPAAEADQQADAYDGPVGEVLRVQHTQASRDDAQRIAFDGPIQDAVVIAGLRTTDAYDPAVARVHNVDDNGFDLSVQEFEYQDGVRGAEDIQILALKAGSYTLDSGKHFEVGTVEVDGDPVRVEFDQAFEGTPVVFSTIQSNNDPTAVTIRQLDVDATGFSLYLQEEEALGLDQHNTETVGYVVFEEGSDALDAFRFSASNTGDNVTHTGRWASFAGVSDDPTVFAAEQTDDGWNTSYAAFSSVSAGGGSVYTAEEQSGDTEISHTTEAVGVLALDGVGRIGPEPVTPTANDNSGLRFSTTPELAFNSSTIGLRSIGSDDLGNSSHKLADLAAGGELAYADGDRTAAIQAIDAAISQVNRSRVGVNSFVTYTVGSLENVTQATAQAVTTRRQSLENAAGAQATAEVARLTLLQAGITLANQAAEAQAQTLISLLEQASGEATSARVSAEPMLTSHQQAQHSRLFDALDRYNESMTNTQETSLADLTLATTQVAGLNSSLDLLA